MTADEPWRTGEDAASRLTRELVSAALLPCRKGGGHAWRKSKIDIVTFGKEEPIRHYEHWTCSTCGLLDAVERDCGA